MDAEDLWAALYDRVPGFLEVRVVADRGSPGAVQRRFFQCGNALGRRRAAEFAASLDGRGCVTFGVQPRWKHAGTTDAVLSIVALTVDMDCGGDPERFEQAQDRLGAFPLPYSALVASGHGLHAYWFLREPLAVAGKPAERDRYLAVAKRLSSRLKADHTWDLARVLRVPGTLNVKAGDSIRSGLVELGEVRHTLEEFEHVLPPETALKRVFQPRGQWGRKPLPAWVARLIEQGNDGRYPSRSEADFAVVCALVERGYGDGEIEAVFASHPQGIGAKYAERGERYLRSVIGGARRKVAS